MRMSSEKKTFIGSMLAIACLGYTYPIFVGLSNSCTEENKQNSELIENYNTNIEKCFIHTYDQHMDLIKYCKLSKAIYRENKTDCAYERKVLANIYFATNDNASVPENVILEIIDNCEIKASSKHEMNMCNLMKIYHDSCSINYYENIRKANSVLEESLDYYINVKEKIE